MSKARTKLTVRVKRAWMKALRSGKFKQGHGKLYDPKTRRYCCLGVLARIQGCRFNPELGFKFPNGNTSRSNLEGWGETLGLDCNQESSLIDLNDNVKSNFKGIAVWISKNL
jgi:hypothetical protein